MSNIEDKLRKDFKALLKTGKEGVWKFIEEAESLLAGIDTYNDFDSLVMDILKQVRTDKRFDFQQYKEVIRFVKEHQRLNANKPQEDNDYIIL
jgi:hypothetical protein